MGSPHDVAFGRLAIARGWVAQRAVHEAWSALPPERSLAHELVGRRLLRPEQAQALLAELVTAPASDATVQFGAAATPGSPASGGMDDETVEGAGAGPLAATPSARLRLGLPPDRRGGLPELGRAVAGRYRIEAVLGKGGMGAVYRASDLQRGGEPVAVKVMLAESNPEGTALARFRREAEAVARVDAHAGVVRVRDFGADRGQPYCVMDLVEGRDLWARVKAEGPLPVDEALEVTERVCRAIAHCHGKGVLHRDLKPANILVRAADGAPFVTDFGLARATDEERLTRTGEVMGTPAYMSPEQADGRKDEVDALTDVYALGGILYALVTGRAPFTGEQVEVFKQVFLDPPQPVNQHRPDAPAGVDAVCQKAMAKDKALRYPSAQAFADELARLRRGEPIEARPPTRWEHLRWRLRKRDRRAVAQVALALGLPVVALFAIGAAFVSRDALKEQLARVPAVLAATDPLLEGNASPALLSALDGIEDDAAQSATARSERDRVLQLVERLWRSAREAAGEGAEEGSADRAEQVEYLLALARGERGARVDAPPGALRDLVRLLRRAAIGWGQQVEVAGAEADDPEGRLIAALAQLRWRPSWDRKLPEESPPPQQLLEEADLLSATGSLERLAAEHPQGDPVGDAARVVLDQRARVEAAVQAYFVSEQAWLRAQARAVLEERGAAPSEEACDRDGWRSIEALEAVELAPVVPVRNTLLASSLVGGGKSEAITEAITTLEEALKRSPARRRDDFLLVQRWAVRRLARFAAAWPPVADADPWRRFATLLGVVLERVSDRADIEIDRCVGDLYDAVERHLPPEAASEGTRARVFDRLASLCSVLSIEAGLEPSDEQLAEMIERLALFPRIRRLPGNILEGSLRRLERRRAFATFVQRHPWGDVFLVWAETIGMQDPEDRNQDDLVLAWDERVLSLIAAALGAELSPAERQALDLTGLRYAQTTLERPLAPCWVPYARFQVGRRVVRRERHQPEPRVEVLDAAARLLEGIQAAGAGAGPGLSDTVTLAGLGGHYLGEVADLLASSRPERAAQLHESAGRWFETGLEWAFEFVRQARDPVAPEVAGSMYYVTGTDRDHLHRYVFNVAKRRATWLVERGRVDEGLEVLPAVEQRLLEEHGLTDEDAAFVRFQAGLANDAGRFEQGARWARRALEVLAVNTQSRDEERHFAGCRDQARRSLYNALQRSGQREQARQVLAEARADGAMDAKKWRDLLGAVGE